MTKEAGPATTPDEALRRAWPETHKTFGMGESVRKALGSQWHGQGPGRTGSRAASRLVLRLQPTKSRSPRLHRGKPASSSGPDEVHAVGCDSRWLLRLAAPPTQ